MTYPPAFGAPATPPRPGRMIGLRPAKNAPAVKLAASLTGPLPVHPATADHFSQVDDWGLFKNDTYGDCGPTSVANDLKLVTRYLTGTEISVTLDDVLDLYRRSGNPDFDPADPGGPGDGGVDMQTMLEALLAGGIGGHKPLAFAKLNHLDVEEIKAAISIFGSVLLGVVLDEAQQTQTDHGGPWDYVPTATWGGHAVVAGAYNAHTYRGDIGVVTWAEVMGTTDSFVQHQLQEAWVVIWPEHLQNPAFQQGVDLVSLAADYEALTGRPFPRRPTPGPAPQPQPTPPPQPVPAPPAVVVDRADRELAAAVGDFVNRHHPGRETAGVSRALRDWMHAKGLR